MSTVTRSDSLTGISVERNDRSNGEAMIRLRSPLGYGAEVRKEHDFGDLTWGAASVSYPSYGAQTAAEVLEHVAVLSLACSLAVQLDAEHPTGSYVAGED